MEFNKYRLDDICEKITDGSHSSPKKVENGYYMYSVKDMNERGFDSKSAKKISRNDFDKLVNNGCKPLENDILIAKDGSYLKNVFVVKEEKEEVILSSIAILRPNKKLVVSDYLAFYLKNPRVKEELKNGYVSGSVLPRIVLKDFKKLPIFLPNIAQQLKVVNMLNSLDEKIDLNNKILLNLEQLSQTLFKHWFIDFEFPNEQGQPYKSSGGEMVESELGEIPKGWKIIRVNYLAEIISKGTTPRKKDISDLEHIEKTIPFLKVKDINDNGEISWGNLEQIPIEIHDKQLKRSKLKSQDILISIAGTIGRISYVPTKIKNLNINQAIAFVRLENTNYFGFLLLYFKTDTFLNYLNRCIVQAVQANVSLGNIKDFKLIIPPMNIINKWNALYEPLFNMIELKRDEIENLIVLRDTLLPKLLSGEIEIPDELEVK